MLCQVNYHLHILDRNLTLITSTQGGYTEESHAKYLLVLLAVYKLNFGHSWFGLFLSALPKWLTSLLTSVTPLEQLGVYKKILGFCFFLVLKVKGRAILIFKVIFLCQKLTESFWFFFIEEYIKGSPTFIIYIFSLLWF